MLSQVIFLLCYYYVMRIALDITPIFQDRPTGVSYYCASVIHALVKYESHHEYLPRQ